MLSLTMMDACDRHCCAKVKHQTQAYFGCLARLESFPL